MLDPMDLAFVERRRRAVRSWKWAGGGLLLLLLAFGAWLYLRVPNLIVPGRAVDSALAGRLEHSTLLVMAALLPGVMLALLAIAATVVVFGFAVCANERRLLRIIDQAREQRDRG